MSVDRSKQGTAFSGLEANDQTSVQRSRFPSPNTIYGASSQAVSNIFTHSDKPTAEQIMTAAIARMGNNTRIADGENPDFISGLRHSDMLFRQGSDKFSKVSTVADKPSLLGPNISVPSMNVIPDDNTTLDPEKLTVVPPNSDGTFSNYGSAGYGVSIDRNSPEFMPADTVGGTFLKKRGASVTGGEYVPRTSGQETLGEYINGSGANDVYGYEE